MRFVCHNEECSLCGVPSQDYVVNVYRVGGDGRLVSGNAPCPQCGGVRAEINPDPTAALRSGGAVVYSRFAGASMEDKQRMLKQRSHDHYNREIRERREEALKAVERAARGED